MFSLNHVKLSYYNRWGQSCVKPGKENCWLWLLWSSILTCITIYVKEISSYCSLCKVAHIYRTKKKKKEKKAFCKICNREIVSGLRECYLKFLSCLTIRWDPVQKRTGTSLNICLLLSFLCTFFPFSFSFFLSFFFVYCSLLELHREARPACPLARGWGEDFKNSLRGRLLWKSHQGCPGHPSRLIPNLSTGVGGEACIPAPLAVSVKRDTNLSQQKDTASVRPDFFSNIPALSSATERRFNCSLD